MNSYTIALYNPYKAHQHLKQNKKVRMKLFNSPIKCLLLYNCGIWTKADEDKLNAFHRKQLWRVSGLFYPKTIRCTKQLEEIAIPLQVLKDRWKIYGYTLKRGPETPIHKARETYFTENTWKKKIPKGRPIPILPETLNNHIKRLKNNRFELISLSLSDFESLRYLAHNRRIWS